MIYDDFSPDIHAPRLSPVKLHVSSYWNVRADAQELRPDAVISIMDSAHLGPDMNLDPSRHLRLGFHDIETPQDGKSPPAPADIGELLTFARHQKAAGAKSLLIHCAAGVRRSPAAAYIIAVILRHEDPLRVAHVLFREAPFADPNMLMIRHADAQAGLDGVMSKAIKAARASFAFSSQQQSFSI